MPWRGEVRDPKMSQMSQMKTQAWRRIVLLLIVPGVLVAGLSALRCTGTKPQFSGGLEDRASTRPSTTQALATLKIRVVDLRNYNGQLIFGVFRSADGFPTESTKSVEWQIKPIDADEVVFTARLPAGRYGASVLHDENKSGQMERGAFGVPLEGYGVTNNPKPALRAATFDEATFTLPPEGREMTISVQYFN
jgi:uncharacterized protein (DUF2141 family)